MNTTTILAIGIIFFLAVIGYTFYLEKSIKRKISQRDLNKKYKTKATSLRYSRKDPSKLLKETDKLARNFLKELYDVDLDKEYPELEEDFKKANKLDIASFCAEMTNLYYVKEKHSLEDVRKIISKLQTIISSHRITKEYKEDAIDKTSRLLRKGFISRVKKNVFKGK